MIKPLSAAIGSILLASAMSASVRAQEAAPAAADAAQEADKDEDETVLGATIVTGQRSPKAVDKIPGAITVVSEEEVEHTLAITEDATAVLARTVPGYSESSQAMSNTGENLRGRIALRLFDGVPQGSPLREGTRNGTFTDMGVISRIEVINGPSASEGIGAAGGIINYISKVPTKEGSETTLVARYSTQFADDSQGWKLGANYAYKNGNYDFLGSVSRIDRGISYDGDGRRVGMNTSGSVSDSVANNLFLKAGFNFGADAMQRLQASYSQFKIEGNGNYIQVEGCRFDPVSCPEPTTNTSERGSIFGSKAEFNDFEQFVVQYSNQDLFGGVFVMDYYNADQAMRYLPENGDDKQVMQVPVIGEEPNCRNPAQPCGVRIYDQSEIDSKKQGLRTSWTRPELFNVEGLELRIGLDLVEDEAQQRLALTDRVWVPPMEYSSTAPYAQLSWDIGAVTLSGGLRQENGELNVDSYTTTYFRNSVFVQGGGVEYKENMANFGAIWRIGAGWSVFASYGEGFGLPNIGIPLRNINQPGLSVERIADIDPIIVDNTEFGFNYRGSRGSFSGSHYQSNSDFGASLSIDPVTNDFILTRGPVEIEGIEFAGDYRISDTWKVTALYSNIEGFTQFFNNGGLNRPIGVLDINPDKFAASVIWNYLPNGELTFGGTQLFDRDLSASQVRTNPDGSTSNFSYEEHTEGYVLFDLSVNYQSETWGKVTLGIENVFDKQYILSWSQVPGFQNFWAGRGRMTSLSYSYTF